MQKARPRCAQRQRQLRVRFGTDVRGELLPRGECLHRQHPQKPRSLTTASQPVQGLVGLRRCHQPEDALARWWLGASSRTSYSPPARRDTGRRGAAGARWWSTPRALAGGDGVRTDSGHADGAYRRRRGVQCAGDERRGQGGGGLTPAQPARAAGAAEQRGQGLLRRPCARWRPRSLGPGGSTRLRRRGGGRRRRPPSPVRPPRPWVRSPRCARRPRPRSTRAGWPRCW